MIPSPPPSPPPPLPLSNPPSPPSPTHQGDQSPSALYDQKISTSSTHKSATPSEVLGYLDDKIGHHTLSTSTITGYLDRQTSYSTDVEPHTPESVFGLQRNPFSIGSTSSSSSSDSDSDVSYHGDSDPNKNRNRITSDFYAVNSSASSTDEEDNDPKRCNMISTSRSQSKKKESSAVQGTSSSRIRKIKKKKSKPNVSKYKENTRTVRQQIKPGTVEDLTTLFTGWKGSQTDHVLSHSYPELHKVELTNSEKQSDEHPDKLDFITASKVIREKLILSRHGSLKNAMSGDEFQVSNSNDNVHITSGDMSNSTHTNVGPDDEGVNRKNTVSMNYSEDGKNDDGGGGMMDVKDEEGTNMTVGLQLNNECKIDESKHGYARKDNLFSKPLETPKGSNSIFGVSPNGLGRDDGKMVSNSNETKETHDNVTVPISLFEASSDVNSHLSEFTQAKNTSTHSYTVDNGSSDLSYSHQSTVINKHTPQHIPLKTGSESDNGNTKSITLSYGNVTDMNNGDSFVVKDGQSAIVDELEDGTTEENRKKRGDSHLWHSRSNSTCSTKDVDGHSLTNQDSWITVDVIPSSTNKTHLNDERTMDATGNKSDPMTEPLAYNDLNNFPSQTNASKNYIISSHGRTDAQIASKPPKETFIKTEKLNQTEQSANVNAQLLENLHSQTREGSRLDVFAHSTRVWDDEDGGGNEGEGRERDAATTGDTQTNKRPVTLHSQLQQQSEQYDSVRNGDFPTTVNSIKENGKQEDDFLSILDTIKLDTDVTPYHIRNRGKFYADKKQADTVSDSGENKAEVISTVGSMKKRNKIVKSGDINVTGSDVIVKEVSDRKVTVSKSENRDFGDNRDLSASTKSNIEEELQKLHRSLSPQTSFRDRNVKLETSFDSQNSDSSSRREDKIDKNKQRAITRETAFNVDFFTSSSKEDPSTRERENSRDDKTHHQVEESFTVTKSTNVITSPPPVLKTNGEVSISQGDLTFESSPSHDESSGSCSNEIPANESKEGGIISSRESFRSVRQLFENKEENNNNISRSSSVKNRRSLNLERSPSLETARKWRRSGSEFSSWIVGDIDIKPVDNDIVNKSENTSVQYLEYKAVDKKPPLVLEERITRNKSSSSSDSDGSVSKTSGSRKIKKKYKVKQVSSDPFYVTVNADQNKHDSLVNKLSNSYDKSSKEENNGRPDSVEKSKGDDMTAVVGEVSSFNIHRRMTSQEESSNMSSPRTVTSNNGASDVYLVQDKSGEVYAIQELNTPQPVLHGQEADNYRSFDTSMSSHQTSFTHSINERPADIYVDGSNINDSKAREVISAYLQSESPYSQTNTSQYQQTIPGGATGGTLTLNNTSSSSSSHPHSIIVHQGGNTGGYITNSSGVDLTNSTVTVDRQVNTKSDTSQTWSSSHHDPYTLGGGGENSYKSSLVVTNFNTPRQQVYSTAYSNTPSMDTSIDSQQSNGMAYVTRSPSNQMYQPLVVNVSPEQGNVRPFRTKPVTVQTTTSAIVGEKVDMKIDFPVIQQPLNVTTTAELVNTSSDEENKRNYIIKSVSPKKSSLKKSSDNNTSMDSDITYRKTESVIGDIVIGGGKNRSTVFDNRTNTDHTSKTYVVSNASNNRGRKKNKISGNVKHHSPERIFRNPQLTLRRGDHSSGSPSSDDDSTSKHYRTVTHVVVDTDGVDSGKGTGSESPPNRYQIISPQSTVHQSSPYHDNSLSDDDHYYEVDSRHSEIDTRGNRRRYKVINTSQNIIDSQSVRAHSSPKPYKTQSQSFEESHVKKTEHTTPSKFQTLPSSSKRHKTVIQLDLDNKKIRERGRSESDASESSPKLWRAKSFDSLGGSLKVFNTNNNRESKKLWRTGRTRSVGSSSDESNSDLEGSGPYNMSPHMISTSKQRRGNKTYVVNSTVDDHHTHPSGWFKSTIDINENAPHAQRSQQNYILKSTNASNHNSSQREIISEQRSGVSMGTTEKSVYYSRGSSKPSYTQIPVQASPDSGRGTEVFTSDAENENMKKKFERVERIYEVRTEPDIPEQFLSEEESVSRDMRVLRGKILIQNRMDDSSHMEDDFDQNVNIFDSSFHTGKDNPLYASDSDLMAALQREEQQEMSRHVTQDITYDQVDRVAQKYKTTAGAEIRSKPKKQKQNLSTLLLSKLSNIDSKDIRQTINVEHHNEEIFGDISFIHADGKRSQSKNTSNFDSVTENVELALQQGKAHIVIKVIAERIMPTDIEFNVWRKSQAIVTRRIEIDLLANAQRRRFYNHVMDTQGRPSMEHSESGGFREERMTTKEKQLNSMETLKLFSQILDITDGQGDKDHTTMRTKQEMGQIPKSGADLLY